MSFNFGNISFRQGRSAQADLPLDVIGAVGTNLTNRYNTNRQAYSKLKEQVLNLPDSNSEGNKKIITKLSEDVKSSFSKYAEQGNWWDADSAVYDAMDKITSSQEVKDLYKYNAQYAKVDESIENSGASELDKQTRRAMNQQVNKGIRDDNGNAISYQGRALSGDLDIAKYYKKYDDLIKGFEADMESYSSNPSTFNMEMASDGFQQAFMRYGDTKITHVDKAEVSSYLRGLVENDSKFKAELNDIAELELFRNTSKLKADRDDVSKIIDRKAGTSPTLQLSMIYSSSRFNKETEKMNDAEKYQYANKIMSNAATKNVYYSLGKEDLLNSKGIDYDQVYKGSYLSNAMDMLDNGISNKYSYRRVDNDVKYITDPLGSERHKAYLQNLGTHSLVSTFGNVDVDGISTYLDVRDQLNKDINTIKGILANPNLDEETRRDKTKILQDLESSKRTKDFIIDSAVKNTNMSDNDIFDVSKKDNISEISSILNADLNASPWNILSYDFGSKSGKNYHKLSIEKSSDIYEIAKATSKLDLEETKKALEKKGIILDDNYIEKIKESVGKRFENNMQKVLKSKGVENISLPIVTIGNIGANQPTYAKAMADFGKQWSLGVGDFEFVSTSDKDWMKKGTNLGRQKTFVHPTKKLGGSFPVEVQLATMANDSPSNTGEILLNIIETNPEDGTKSTHLVRYTGNNVVGHQVMNEVLTSNAIAAFKPNNANFYTDTEAAKFAATVLGGNLPAESVGTEKISGLTLSGALNRIQRVFGDEYDTVNANINGIDARIVTTRSNGIYNQQVFDNRTNKPISDVISGSSPNNILQYIGAIQALQTNGVSTPAGINIAKLFNINLTK